MIESFPSQPTSAHPSCPSWFASWAGYGEALRHWGMVCTGNPNHGILNPSLSPGQKTAKELRLGSSTRSSKTENISPCSPALYCNPQTGPPALVEMSQLGFRDGSHSSRSCGGEWPRLKARLSPPTLYSSEAAAVTPGRYSRGLGTPLLGCGCGRRNGCML